MFEGRHAADRYHLRLHRARSVILTSSEILEIRAAQRTFEGAYIRTALGQFSFSLVVLKIFTAEFYSIGALFALYGTGILLASLLRRQQGNRQFFTEVDELPGGIMSGGLWPGGGDGEGTESPPEGRKRFRTSGNVVVVVTALSVAAYITLLVLTLRLESEEKDD